MAAELAYAGAGTAKNTPSDPATWTAAPIGTASADRYVVVCVGGGDDSKPGTGGANLSGSSATIGGASMTRLQVRDSTTGGIGGQAASAAVFISDSPVTSGTTADFVLSSWTEGATDDINITVYALTGADPAPTDTVSSNSNTTTALDIPANGCAVGVICHTTEAGNTWALLGEDYDADIGEVQLSSAKLNTATAQTGQTISATGGGTNAFVLVAWGPAAAAARHLLTLLDVS